MTLELTIGLLITLTLATNFRLFLSYQTQLDPIIVKVLNRLANLVIAIVVIITVCSFIKFLFS